MTDTWFNTKAATDMARAAITGLMICFAVVPAPAAVSDRFDLACHGVTTTTAPGIAPVVRPTDGRMSIDLTKNRWCWRKAEACMQVFAIKARQGSRLTLRDGSTPQGSSRVLLDLSTGRYASRIHIATPTGPAIDAIETGRCATAGFTRIP